MDARDNTRRLLRVFLASPGDVVDERRLAFDAAARVNAITGPKLGWEVQLSGWEDTLPGFGRPQEIINEDVDRADLFIGILWKRWGQPTGEFSSGFEEEFNRALARRRTSLHPEIAMFFKSLEPDDIRDPGQQLQRVLGFRRDLVSERLVLFREFDSLEEWSRLVFQTLITHVIDSTSSREATLKPSHSARRDEDVRSAILKSSAEPLGVTFSSPSTQDHSSPSGDSSWDLRLDRIGSLLVVGPPGSGKSNALMVALLGHSLLLDRSELQVFLIETQGMSMSRMRHIPQCVGYVHPQERGNARAIFQAMVDEIESRWRLFQESGARDFSEHVRLGGQLPRAIVVVDGLDTTVTEDPAVEPLVVRLAAYGRSAGVHLIATATATERLGFNPEVFGWVVRLLGAFSSATGSSQAGAFNDPTQGSRRVLNVEVLADELVQERRSQLGPSAIEQQPDEKMLEWADSLDEDLTLRHFPLAREGGTGALMRVDLRQPLIVLSDDPELRGAIASQLLAILRRGLPHADLMHLSGDDTSQLELITNPPPDRQLIVSAEVWDRSLQFPDELDTALRALLESGRGCLVVAGADSDLSAFGVPASFSARKATLVVPSPSGRELFFLHRGSLRDGAPAGGDQLWLVTPNRTRAVALLRP